MKKNNTNLHGVFIIEPEKYTDARGSFTKTFHFESFKENNLSNVFKESFYSVSHKNVIRGMHFQLPPHDHDKLVYVSQGKILDVVLDLRKSSMNYGKYFSVYLSAENKRFIYIPKGCAHGFKALVDNTITIYNVTTVYNKDFDSGIKWDSFGFNWMVSGKIIISDKDISLIKFNSFNSPF